MQPEAVPQAPQPPRLRLRVTSAAENRIRSGHPWLFSDSIREVNREGVTGDLAVIFDRQDRFLAIGLFDADSPIRLRVLQTLSREPIAAPWWKARLQASADRRKSLFDASTNGYRCLHGENDGLPGLVIDRYDQTLVMKIYTASWLPHLPTLIPLIREVLPSERLVFRTSRNIQAVASKAGFKEGDLLYGPALLGPVPFRETGIAFEADVIKGQKTGFFLDQRENRRWVETVARGRKVLNAFSFSGGFSLYAARGGATGVTNLDISAHALAAAARNFELNASQPQIRNCPHEAVQADAFEWLASSTKSHFDLVILDPPSLAKRELERQGAIQAYRRLARLGWNQLRPHGILAAASCSGHVTAEEFFQATRLGIVDAGGQAEEIHHAQHPPDHPAGFPEAHYLKCIAFRAASRR
ncbi:MAG: class I SAM-dependent methyltransferase [Verrucomicrobiales bacterium]|nr:class I SAM-dependent methyltransferase [Verrucomicrobiales bacterium]